MLPAIFKRQPYFFLLFGSAFVWGVSCLLMYPWKEVFLSLNFFHTDYLNTFFLNYTLLGDGIISILLFFLLLSLNRVGVAFRVLLAYIVSGLAVQLMKSIITAPRPKVVFSATEFPAFIQSIAHAGSSSFPSGHTTSAFALATILSLHSRSKWFGFGFGILASIVGYSRIYLGQHFLQDVLAGALLGIISAILVYRFVPDLRIDWANRNTNGLRISME